MKLKCLLLAASILAVSQVRADGSYTCNGDTSPPSTLTLNFANPSNTAEGLIVNGVELSVDNRDGNGYYYDVLNLNGGHFLMRVCSPNLSYNMDIWMCVSYWCK